MAARVAAISGRPSAAVVVGPVRPTCHASAPTGRASSRGAGCGWAATAAILTSASTRAAASGTTLTS